MDLNLLPSLPSSDAAAPKPACLLSCPLQRLRRKYQLCADSPPIYLHNSLTGKKEEFIPQDEKNVRMYVCGPTVYAPPHIGNMRPVVVFDVLYRLLRWKYGADHVTYVRNITDVDDKIIEAARERNVDIGVLTKEVEKEF